MKLFLRQIFRQLRTDKHNTLISIFSLIIGIGVFSTILLYITKEFNYNHLSVNENRIYRILNENNEDNHTWGKTPFVAGKIVKENLPEIKNSFHLYSIDNAKVRIRNEKIQNEKIICTESDFFDILGIPVLEGSLNEFDKNKSAIAIDESTAKKYFGNKSAIGKSISISQQNQELVMFVVAVFRDIPNNSSFHSCLISNIPFSLEQLSSTMISNGKLPTDKMIIEDWSGVFYTNFILVKKNTNIEGINNKIKSFGASHTEQGRQFNFSLQPLSDIYFHSNTIIDNNIPAKGNLPMLWMLISIAVLILFISWVNYINLTISNSLSNLKNNAIQKICGAPNRILFLQFMTKSFLIALIAIPFALIMAKKGSVLINELTNKNYAFIWDKNLTISLTILSAIIIITSLLSGSIIALKINNLSLIHTLKGDQKTSKHRSSNTLLVFQLTIFIALFASSMFMNKQMSFLLDKDMGFSKEGLLCIPLNGNSTELFKQEILKNPDIISAAGTMWMPPTNSKMIMTFPKIDDLTQMASLQALYVDYGFMETMGIKITQGKPFTKDSQKDGVLISESAIKELGLTSFIGKQTAMGKIIGVFKDFNMNSLHNHIQPTIIGLNKNMCRYMAVRIHTNNIQSCLTFLDRTWKNCGFHSPFQYAFTDELLNNLYKSDLNFSRLIQILTAIAMLLSIIGLTAIAIHIAKQKRKEIGIRKVNGAKTKEILMMINQRFIQTTMLACVFAIPLSYYFIHQWLENFAYKTDISWWIFVAVGITSAFIVSLTVVFQSWRAANQNPVEALRNE